MCGIPRGGVEKWVPGTVISRLGPLTYLVRAGRHLRYVHIDHLLRTERLKFEEAFDKVVPEESSVPVAVPVSVSRTPPRALSASVSESPLEIPAQTPNPVAEPVPEYRTRNTPAAQEPVPKSLTQIPVAVSESEPPPQMPHQSETVPRDSPIRTERRYPAREKKAPDRLNL